MKLSTALFLFTLALSSTGAAAQTNLSQYVQHVVIVIQENRTPDNLFNQDSVLASNGGRVSPVGSPTNDKCLNPPGYQQLTGQTLYTCWDLPRAVPGPTATTSAAC
ncbi:MAG TPA: hypothetical protein VF753_15140 [Terriglobales bacterium]